MSSNKMGGPAFPVNSANECNPGAYAADPGMTLWDHYAAYALCGLIAEGPHDCIPRKIAHDAAVYADAMLAERQRREVGNE